MNKLSAVLCKLVSLLCLGLIPVILMTACSVIQTDSEGDSDNPQNKTSSVSTPDSPFSLKVLDLISTADSTEIFAEIKTKTDWDISEVTVNFSVFKNGDLKASLVKPLADFVIEDKNSGNATNPDILPAETTVPVHLQIEVGMVTDYQINLGWGAEAELSRVESLTLRDVKILDLGADNVCKEEPCQHQYSIEAVLFNKGRVKIRTAKLSLSLSSNNDRLAPADGSIVELNPLDLPAQTEQTIRLRLSQPLWPEQAQALIPDIKIISHN